MIKALRPVKIKKRKVDHRLAWVQEVGIGFGATLYVYWNRASGGPMGFVWGFSHTHSFDVFGSYVLPECRRQGVRTRINAEIFKTHKVVKTWAGTNTGGFEFLKRSGYRFNKTAMQWCKRQK